MKIILVLTLAVVMATVCGCGGGGGSQTAAKTVFRQYSSGTWFNPGQNPVTLSIVSTTGAAAPAKVLALNVGDSVDSSVLGSGMVPVAGCLDPVQRIKVCYSSTDQSEQAHYLAGRIPDVLTHVNAVLGPPGAVDIVIAGPSASQYGGVYDPDKNLVVIAAGEYATQQDLFYKAGHELTHAAYFKVHGSALPFWLNESIAEMTMQHMGYVAAGYVTFDGNDLTATPTNDLGYYRVYAVGSLLGSLQKHPLAEALKYASPDPVRAITELSLADFARIFWQKNSAMIPPPLPGTITVPAYGAINLSGYTAGTDGLVKFVP